MIKTVRKSAHPFSWNWNCRDKIFIGWDNSLAPAWGALPEQNKRNLFRRDRFYRVHLHLCRRQALSTLPRDAQAPRHLWHICPHQVLEFFPSGTLVSTYMSLQCFHNTFYHLRILVIIFVLFSVLMAVFTILCVPETRGRSLAEIQSMYGEVGSVFFTLLPIIRTSKREVPGNVSVRYTREFLQKMKYKQN